MAFRSQTIDRDLLLLSEVIVEGYDASAEEILEPLFTMLLQASRFDRNCNCDQQGQRIKECRIAAMW